MPRPGPVVPKVPRPVRHAAGKAMDLLTRQAAMRPAPRTPGPGDADSRPLRLALAVLWWEMLWAALWQPLSLAGLFLALAWMGLFTSMSAWIHVPLLLAALVGIGWLVRRGWREFRVPTEGMARRRLERDSALDHRPLTQLQDGLAGGAGDPLAHVLWRMAQERARAQAANLTIAGPDSGLPARDPLALRVAVALLLVVGGTVGWGDLPGRTMGALMPSVGASGWLAPVRLDAWATPPTYTAQAPVFLTRPAVDAGEAKPIFLPLDTKLVVRLDGGYGTPVLVANETETEFQPVAGGGWQVELALRQGEDVSVRQMGRQVVSWPIRIVPDGPPGIAFRTPPSITDRNSVRIDYTAADDYGIEVVTATVTIAMDVPPAIDRTPIDLPLPVPARNKREVAATGFHDLTSHPWAGMPVTIRLRAQDGAGQTAQSAEQPLTLPERRFTHPVARAIIDQRKALILLGDDMRAIVARALNDISGKLDGYGGDPLAFLTLRSAVGRLMLNDRPDTVASTVAMLWDVALRIEDGNLSLAERELRDAQQSLMEAIDRGADDAELAQAMDRLEQAMADFLDALEQQAAQQAQQNGEQTPPPGEAPDTDAQMMTREDLEAMIRQMRDLAQTGSRDAARQMLSQLQQMMENLQNGQPQSPGDAQANQQAQALGELTQKLRELQQRQQQLMDETFQQQQQMLDGGDGTSQLPLPGLAPPNRQGRRPSDGPQGRNPSPQSAQGAGTQEDLRGELGEIMQQLGELGADIPRPLGRAERAMRDATQALRGGAPDQAVASQGEVLEQLQQSLQSLQEQMVKASPGQAGGQRAQSGRQPGRDPLGRPLPGTGTLTGEDVKIPAEADLQRARQILEELRRRAGEQNRPKAERDYIDRLLDRFNRY